LPETLWYSQPLPALPSQSSQPWLHCRAQAPLVQVILPLATVVAAQSLSVQQANWGMQRPPQSLYP
jgi:hypothetical protein